MTIKQTLRELIEGIRRAPKKTIAIASLAALVATTALKDNVHFGSSTVYNPKKNQYVWGIAPTTEIKGERAEGNIYTIGLLGCQNKYQTNLVHNGNSTAIGLVLGGNEYKICSAHNGNSTSMGLAWGENIYLEDSKHDGNSIALGLVAALNRYNSNSVHSGNSRVIGMLSHDEEGSILGAHKIVRNTSGDKTCEEIK